MEIHNLINAGGREWKSEDGTKHRIYFNDLAERLGWEVFKYNTGNISCARLNGVLWSNNKAGFVLSRLGRAKFWYDIDAGQFAQNGDLTDEEFALLTGSFLAIAA